MRVDENEADLTGYERPASESSDGRTALRFLFLAKLRGGKSPAERGHGLAGLQA